MKSHLPDSFKDNDRTFTNSKEIANKFNDYFVNVGPKLASKIRKSKMSYTKFLTKRYINSFFIDPVTEKEVEGEISKLKVDKSCGYDEIPAKIVRNIPSFITKPLTHIFNQSLLSGVIPEQLKIALVTPAFKANDRELSSNYRMISVLPCFSKILEKLMYKRIMKYLDKQNIPFHSQYGLRKNHSTNLATLDLVTELLHSTVLKKNLKGKVPK